METLLRTLKKAVWPMPGLPCFSGDRQYITMHKADDFARVLGDMQAVGQDLRRTTRMELGQHSHHPSESRGTSRLRS